MSEVKLFRSEFGDVRTSTPTALGGAVKRAFDITGALFLIVLLAPLMVMIAVSIFGVEGGPFFIRHKRVGHKGQEFGCFKFRTMVKNADEKLEEYLMRDPVAAMQWRKNRKLVDDPRITPLGNVLRKSSLDELPQLLNIVKGEMSLVGPRPIVRDETVNYGTALDEYMKARPGLTGLWQVKGRSNTSYEERVKLDCDYVSSWSFRRDIFILLMTIPSVLAAKGSQ